MKPSKKMQETELRKTQVKLPETVQLHNKDFRELKIPDNSISLIFTDPPYTENSLYLCAILGTMPLIQQLQR